MIKKWSRFIAVVTIIKMELVHISNIIIVLFCSSHSKAAPLHPFFSTYAEQEYAEKYLLISSAWESFQRKLKCMLN